MNILFFGSTSDSVIILEKLHGLSGFSIGAVVTQPPRPVGRDKTVTPTPVERWAKDRNITTLSFPSDPEKPWKYADEVQVIDTLDPVGADLVISASYGQMIPWETIHKARFGGLNVHPSILPRFRGGDPVPWAIMAGDHQIGVTVVGLSERFDEGLIYARKKIPVTPHDTSSPLRTRLFDIGAHLLADILPDYVRGRTKGKPQIQHSRNQSSPDSGNVEAYPYAKRLTRETGFEPWPFDQKDAIRIERKYRALHPWPGVWTTIDGKRLKILKLHLTNDQLVIDEVQLEGKKPVSWKQFTAAYLSPIS